MNVGLSELSVIMVKCNSRANKGETLMMVKARLSLVMVVLVLVAVMLGACSKAVSGPTVGGPCQYVDVPGVARIVSVVEAASTDYNCANAVKVTFDFVPNDPTAVNNYRFPNWEGKGQCFMVGAGMNPPKSWVLEQGLTEGSEHACVRSEITKGTCTPVIFSFPEIKKEGWEKECFGK